jgi:hypothetical protein
VSLGPPAVHSTTASRHRSGWLDDRIDQARSLRQRNSLDADQDDPRTLLVLLAFGQGTAGTRELRGRFTLLPYRTAFGTKAVLYGCCYLGA